MVVFETLVAACLSPIISRPLSRNQSSKIRVPLTDAKKTVISALETLRSVQEILDQRLYKNFFEDCRKIDESIDRLLKASNQNVNIFNKTLRYRKMVNVARSAHAKSLRLHTRVQRASLNALMAEKNKPASLEAKAEEEVIAYMERKIKLHETTQIYQKLLGTLADSESQRSFTLTLGNMTGEAEHASASTPQEDIEHASAPTPQEDI